MLSDSSAFSIVGRHVNRNVSSNSSPNVVCLGAHSQTSLRDRLLIKGVGDGPLQRYRPALGPCVDGVAQAGNRAE